MEPVQITHHQRDPQQQLEVRILRRLLEPGAMLIAARAAPICAVLHPGSGETEPVTSANCTHVEAVHLLEAGFIRAHLITPRSARYVITDQGRAHVRCLLRGQPRVTRAPDAVTLLTWSRRRHMRRQGRAV